MLARTYDTEVCSAARSLEVVGERWSLLIIRNLMFTEMRRFNQLQESLGVAPNILSSRLQLLIDTGVVAHSDGDAGRSTYALTERGQALRPVLLALTAWGDIWLTSDERGVPITYRHEHCDGSINVGEICERCGKAPSPQAVAADVADWVRPERERRRAARRSTSRRNTTTD